ncbi:MAG: rbfA [Sedimentibacter sp.]|nr:rbfA [Sedimentibacter sp.]
MATLLKPILWKKLKDSKKKEGITWQIEETADCQVKCNELYLKREIGKRIKMRIIPELIFEKDDSIEKGIYMSSLINRVIEEEASRKVEDESDDE